MSNDQMIYYDDIEKISFYTRNGKGNIIHCYFTVNKRKYRKSTKTDNKKEAVKIGRKFKKQAEKGLETKTLNFKQAYIEFIKNCKFRIERNDKFSKNTLRDYTIHGSIAAKYFGNIDVTNINQNQIDKFVRWRSTYYHDENNRQSYFVRNGKKFTGRKFKRNISNRTINYTMTVVFLILKYCCERNYLEFNRLPKFKQLKTDKRETFIKKHEVEKICRYYENNNKRYYSLLIKFGFYTGIRMMSEINKIKWGDVSNDMKSVIIRDRKTKGKILNTRIDLLEEARKVLVILYNNRNKKSDDDFVFVNENNRQAKNINKSFKKAICECGINENYTIYSLRHGFASYVLNVLKWSNFDAAKVLGHSSTKMVDDVYGHYDYASVNDNQSHNLEEFLNDD